MKKAAVIALLCLAIASCELIVDVDMPPHQAKLVVNSIITTDSNFRASVSLSRDILSPDGPFVPAGNATVQFYEGDILIATLVHEGGDRYVAEEGFSPSGAGKYTIRASAPGREPVEAITSVPSAIEILDPEIEFSQGHYSKEFHATFSFQDDPAVENFYQVAAWIETSFVHPQTGEVIYSNQPVWVESSEEADQDDGTIGDSAGILFRDLLFNGKKKEVGVSGSYYQPPGQSMRLKIYLRNINKDYWLYLQSTQLQQSVDGDPLSQPVTVYSNVSNGYGIFAAYSHSVFTVEM